MEAQDYRDSGKTTKSRDSGEKQITKTFMSIIKNNLKSAIAIAILSSLGIFTVFADGALLPQATSQLEEAVATQVVTQQALDLANQNVCIAEVGYASAKLTDYHNNKYELEDGEDLIILTKESQKDCGVVVIDEVTTTIQPEDLYYTFLKSDGVTVSQSPREHFANNKYMATDLATNGRKLQMYAPSFMYHKDGETLDESREYTVKLAANYATMGQTVELHWKEHGVDYMWNIGHIHEFQVEEGQVVKTGEPIAISGGCLGELKLDEKSTGCHTHLELWIDGQAVEYPLDNNTKHNDVGFQ